MDAPPICLFCGHLGAHGDDGAACPECRRRPPEGTWVSEDGKTPSEQIVQPLLLTATALLLFALAAKIVAHAVRARPFGVSAVFLLLGGLVLGGISWLVIQRAGEIAFERRGSFTSTDGRVEAFAHLFAGTLRAASASCYRLQRLDLGEVVGAAWLTSTNARASLPELRDALRAYSFLQGWTFVSDDALVALAAVLGMATRDEIDVMVGRSTGFTFDGKHVHESGPGQVRIWLYAPRDAAPGPPFELHLAEHVRALASARPDGPARAAPPAGYRTSPSREREAEEVAIARVLERFVASSTVRGQAMLDHLRRSGLDEGASPVQVVAAFVAAARIEPETVKAIAIALSTATGAPATVRSPAEDLLSHRGLREILTRADLGAFPEALRPAPPRPDVFSGKGYLRQEKYRAGYLSLLIHGRVAHGICVSYQASGDADGRDVSFQYAWLDENGHIQRGYGEESYDPMHAGTGRGIGDMVVDMDADMERGRVVTVVYARDTHVIYEALQID